MEPSVPTDRRREANPWCGDSKGSKNKSLQRTIRADGHERSSSGLTYACESENSLRFTASRDDDAAWLGALQALSASATVEEAARLAGIASVLSTFTALVCRLGVWRLEMENTNHNVGAELKAHRQQLAAACERLERRLESVDRLVAAASKYQTRLVRWRLRTDRRLDELEREPYDATKDDALTLAHRPE